MIIPIIDTTGKQVGWIDHLKLDQRGNLYWHDEKLWLLTEGATLQEIEPIPLDAADIVPMTEELQ